jgi:chromosome segregation ATPase
MKAKLVYEELRFNFDKNPTDQFRGGFKKGLSRLPTENPRKKHSGLSPEEENIVRTHEKRISDLKDEVEDYEYEIKDLEDYLEGLSSQDFDPEELEQFYSDVQNEYGFEALDILNSGYSMEDKIKAIDALNPTRDFGIREFKNLANNYEFYHPEEVSEEEIKKIEDKIKKLEKQKQERENTIDKLETKIYNIETY